MFGHSYLYDYLYLFIFYFHEFLVLILFVATWWKDLFIQLFHEYLNVVKTSYPAGLCFLITKIRLQ